VQRRDRGGKRTAQHPIALAADKPFELVDNTVTRPFRSTTAMPCSSASMTSRRAPRSRDGACSRHTREGEERRLEVSTRSSTAWPSSIERPSDGVVHELERLVGCQRDRVLGRPLASAVAALHDTALPRDIAETLQDRRPHVTGGAAVRRRRANLEVKLLPVFRAPTLLWQTSPNARRRSWRSSTTPPADAPARGRKKTACEGISGRGLSSPILEDMLAAESAEINASRKVRFASTRTRRADERRIRRTSRGTEHLERAPDRHEDGTYRWILCRGMPSATSARCGLRGGHGVTHHLVDRSVCAPSLPRPADGAAQPHRLPRSPGHRPTSTSGGTGSASRFSSWISIASR